MDIKFCIQKEDHKLYSAMQISCPCFRDKNTLFTRQEIDMLRKTLLAATRNQAGVFLIQVAQSSKNQHKQLMVELGKDRELFEYIMGAL
jgi:hypothetical protein